MAKVQTTEAPADDAKASTNEAAISQALMARVEVLTIAVGLTAALFVVFNPVLFHAPAPRAVLFMLVSMVPALLIGSRAVTTFQLKLPGFMLASTGATAVCLGFVLVLHHIAAPDEKIAMFKVVDAAENKITLEPDGALEIRPMRGAIDLIPIRQGNTLVVVFPSQVGECVIKVRYAGEYYRGVITYAGARETQLKIGQELQLIKPVTP